MILYGGLVLRSFAPGKGGKEERHRTWFWFWRRKFRAHRQMGHGALIRPRPNLFLSSSRFRTTARSGWRKAGSGRALSLGTRILGEGVRVRRIWHVSVPFYTVDAG